MSKRFDRLLEKATDSTLIEPNWDVIIECVDLIRAGEAPIKPAVASIRKRYHNENPHVAHHALLVLEACMKNCGSKFHAEVATKDFMEDLKNLSLDSTTDKVKNKILELLQCWAMAFKNKPEYKIVVDTHNLMKFAGFEFPEVAEAEAMFVAESAPEWADGDECFRCRTAFGLITRKHHCRACGQIFCDKCSSKQSYLPQYGIEKPVRVCDGCFDKTPSAKVKQSSDMDPSAIITSSSNQPSAATLSKNEKPLSADAIKTAEERERELKQAEEDELNLALAISQSEAEAQEEERQRRIYQMYNGTDAFGVRSQPSANPATESSTSDHAENFSYKGTAGNKRSGSESADVSVSHEPDVDPELARYLNRDYWQRRKNEQKNANSVTTPASHLQAERRKTPTPTAPPPSESSLSRSDNDNNNLKRNLSGEALSITSTVQQLDGNITPTQHFGGADEEETIETMEFCKQLNEQVTVMDNRIRSNIARNRSIVNDTAIQSLFIRLTEMHAQVMARMTKLEDQRNYFESLQDHLAHIQEARQAVNALREDYERRKQERALEEQRLRQQQMQQKVDLMRQKKHELLLHQRHMALLRFQQQEQEMQMRRMHQQQQPASYYPGQPVAVPQPPPQIPYASPQQMNVSNQPPAMLQQAYYADGTQQYPTQQYGYPPGTTVAYAAADPNQSLPPPVPQQISSANQIQSQTQVVASLGPQVTSSSQQQINQQNMVNGQANVAQLQQAQYPMQQQSMAQPVMNGTDHSQQQQKPIMQSDSQTPMQSLSNPAVTSNGKMQVPISSASNPIISAPYNGKVIPQQQQQSFMYPQQQGMISQAQPQTMLVGSDYSVYQQQPAAGVIPSSLPQQLNSSYTMPSVDNANSITAQQYANQQQYANTYQVANAGYVQSTMPPAVPNSTVQSIYVPPHPQYANAGGQYYQNQVISQTPSSAPIVNTQTAGAAIEQAQPEVQQPSEGLLISFD